MCYRNEGDLLVVLEYIAMVIDGYESIIVQQKKTNKQTFLID